MIIAYIIVLIVLLFISVFFSSADMAYGSVNERHLAHALETSPNSHRLKLAYKLSHNYDKTISTILLFNDTVNAGLDSFATLLGVLLANEVFHVTDSSTAETYGLIASMIVLVLKITFGEIIAKSVGKIFNQTLVKAYSNIINICYYATLPITFLVGGFGKVITSPITSSVKDLQISDEELHEMVEEAQSTGILDEDKAELLKGTIDYATTEVYEVMTPRKKICAIDATEDIEEIIEDNNIFNFSRIPVYKDTIDNIIGYIRCKDLVRLKIEGKEEHITSILRSIKFFPRTAEINDILQYFRTEHRHIAVVLDEYGGTEGIVTSEDIIEEIVGEIWDETDEKDEPIVERSDGKYIVDGRMNLEDFCEKFDIDYEELDTEYVTIGGFIIELLDDNFAKINQVIAFKNLTMKIIALDQHQTIRKILVTINPQEGED